MFKDIYIYSPLDIRNTVADVMHELHGITEERAFGVRLVLNELLANSILHSGGTRTVLSYRLTGNIIDCAISDDGEWCSSADIVCSNVDEEHGRGVYLASYYTDYLVYDDMHHKIYFKIKVK